MPYFLTPCVILLYAYGHGVVGTIRKKGEDRNEEEIWGPYEKAQKLFVQVFCRFRPLENFVNLIKKVSPKGKNDKE
jgi:hypothetical protein